MRRRARPELEGIFDYFRGREEAPRGRQAPAPRIPAGPDLYRLLGVPPNASIDEIRAAFRSQALKFHPDRNPGDPIAAREFQKLSDALAVFEDPEKRAAYDRARGSQAAAPPPPPALAPRGPSYPVPVPPQAPSTRMPPGGGLPAAPAPPARQRGLWEALFAQPAEPRESGTPARAFFAPFAAPAAPPAAAPPSGPRPPAPIRSFFSAPATPVPIPPSPRPRQEILLPSPEDLTELIGGMWPVDAIWDVVRDERKTPRFLESRVMAIDRVAPISAGTPPDYDLADLFGVPREWVEESLRAGEEGRNALWKEVFYPLFDRLTTAFDMMKPGDVPGRFGLDWSSDGQGIDLLYTELVPRR